MGRERKEYTFFWFIENYSFNCHESGYSFISPSFTIHKLEGTSWNLELYPRGEDDEDEGYISLFLFRSEKDEGPKSFCIECELSLVTVNGSANCRQKFCHKFQKGDGYGEGEFAKTDKIFLQRKANYLPHDILTIRCKIWKGKGKVHYIGQSSARTRIRIKKYSFLHTLNSFSTLQPNVKQTIEIQPHSEDGCHISSNLFFTNSLSSEEKIMIEIIPSDTYHILCKCKLFLLDVSGNLLKCGEMDFCSDTTRKNIQTFPLSLTKEMVLSKKSEYLPDDKLSLICECIFSSGFEFRTMEETLIEIPLDLIKQRRKFFPKSIANKSPEKLSTYPSVSEDMKSVYINQCLTDLELKTETKSFPVHKIVICARSPVFKAMLTSDMKEKNSNLILVSDLEDDILQRMLLFLYSDNLEDIQWENAMGLYYAADKYQINKLKEACTSFLLGNITPTNAGELLLLADTHNDSNFKKLVEDFILEYEDEIFISKEWEMLMERNSMLAFKTMQLRYKRKMEVD